MTTTDLLHIARRVAVAAGELAARRRAQGVQIAASKSSPEDVVTHADRETEALIRTMLAEARPDDGFLGEETGADAGSSGLTWLVDPIDGTVNYLYDAPHWAVSIAVVEGDPEPTTWTALAGAVVNPVINEVFTATRGGGAFLGSRQLRVVEAELSLALVATGFSYQASVRSEQAATLARLISQVRDIRRTGTASLDLCAVACGRVNAFYERGLKPWDHAAGALIAREAGAVVAGLAGTVASAEFLLAAPASLADKIERILTSD
ncbi:MAG: inositol monophosphatase [Microbacteriaceae bacterium]|nr:inositol monophosphatase [Microbacteriaceae bacterium]